MSLTRIMLLLVLSGSLVGCSNSKHSSLQPNSKFIIQAAELSKVISHDSVAVLDLRQYNQYVEGHLPGAVNIWRMEVQNDSFPYQGMLGSKALIESVFENKGISTGQFLVMYDDRGSCEAARLWWMLNYYGYEKMAILDGGVKAWQEVGALTAEVEEVDEGMFELPEIEKTETLISASHLLESDDNHLLIDTRSQAEFSGGMQKNGAKSRGRIPSSIHMDWTNAVDLTTQKFKSIEELDSLYASIIPSKETTIVTYCHSGVRSAHTFFVLTELLGYQHVQNFDGSWVEWTYHDFPVELSLANEKEEL